MPRQNQAPIEWWRMGELAQGYFYDITFIYDETVLDDQDGDHSMVKES